MQAFLLQNESRSTVKNQKRGLLCTGFNTFDALQDAAANNYEDETNSNHIPFHAYHLTCYPCTKSSGR